MVNKFELPDCSPKRKKSVNIASGPSSSNLGPDNLISLYSPIVANGPSNMESVIPEGNQLPAPVSNLNLATELNSESTSASTSATSKKLSLPPAIVVNGQPSNAVIPPNVANIGTGPSSSNQLIVVAPRKTVFISRLHPNTSTDNIRDYVKSKINDLSDSDLKIFKFNSSQPRDIASFKIIVPNKFLNFIVNNSFWPDGILVKEFVFRERPYIPRTVNIPPASKN